MSSYSFLGLKAKGFHQVENTGRYSQRHILHRCLSWEWVLDQQLGNTVGISVWCHILYCVLTFSGKIHSWSPKILFFFFFLYQNNLGAILQLLEVSILQLGKRKEVKLWDTCGDVKRWRRKAGSWMWWSSDNNEARPCCSSFLTALWPLQFWFHTLFHWHCIASLHDIWGLVLSSVHPSFFLS